MEPITPQQLLALAQRHLAEGADPAGVDAVIARETGGQVRTFDQLRQAVAPPGSVAAAAFAAGAFDEPPAADAPPAGGSEFIGAGEALRMGAQGFSFGFADEMAAVDGVPGWRGAALRALRGAGPLTLPLSVLLANQTEEGQEAVAAQRAELGRIREEHPMQALAAEAVGGVLLPGLGSAGSLRGAYTAAKAGQMAQAG
ncbi:MAG TPA: hypothetical protein VFQ76_17675, partial [Longimicrobiaceae bacterium]|nr:hypothetical protein [Longimicrobiaceae bacterium]